MSLSQFDPHCKKCPRLVDFLAHVKEEHSEYYAKPVPPFGDSQPKLLIVGLAPGMHGANATGRPFTGDYAGIMLYETLHRYGFSSHPESISMNDGLTLTGCRITNSVKCLPPNNKPLGAEINNCNGYLKAELALIKKKLIILALGRIAHQSVLKAFAVKQKEFPFMHGRAHNISTSKTLVDCYHCSRYNTQTKRLTAEMFEQIFKMIMERLNNEERH